MRARRSAARPGSRRPASGRSSASARPPGLAAQLFGTDGVRGVAGDLLTAELAVALGRAATAECASPRPQVLLIRDTRESGPMLESGLAAGIAAAGGDALDRRRAADAGRLGARAPARARPRRGDLRLAQPVARQRDQVLRPGRAQARSRGRGADRGARSRGSAPPPAADIGRVRLLEGGLDDYLRELERKFTLDLTGRRIVLDCANGATHRAAPAIFARLGAEVVDARRRARRAQHQRRLRLHPPRAAGRARGRRGRRDRFRLRRRRRPADRRRRVRRGSRRRRGDRPDRPAPRERRHARRRRRRDGDEQLRLPPGDGRGRHRGRDHARSAIATSAPSSSGATGRSAASSPAT